MDIHPVKPWILFSEKKSNSNVVLYDYEEETILHQFSLLSIYDSKKQEINILKMLEKSYNNITLPEYDEHYLKLDKVGEIKKIKLYDPDIIYWKIQNMEFAEGSKKDSILSKIIINTSFAGSIATQQSFKSKVSGEKLRLTKRLKYNPRREPRCIAIQTDTRFTLFKYDEDTSGYIFDEVKSSQLENKTIVTFEFLYNLPLVALGCSDGAIRFWNYSTGQVENDRKIQAHSKSILKMIVVIRIDPLNFLPSLLTYGQDGALCSWNLEKSVAEFKVSKPFDSSSTTIVDMVYDLKNGTILTLGSDKTIQIRRAATGNVFKVVKFTEKTPMKTFDMISTINYLPQWFFMTAQNSKIYSIISTLEDEELHQFDLYKIVTDSNWVKQKAKTQQLIAHPLKLDTFFVSTTNGILIFKMDGGRKLPMSKALFLPEDEEEEEEEETIIEEPKISIPKQPSFSVPNEPEMTTPGDEKVTNEMEIPPQLSIPSEEIVTQKEISVELPKERKVVPNLPSVKKVGEEDSEDEEPEEEMGMFDTPEENTKKKKIGIFGRKKKKKTTKKTPTPSTNTTPRNNDPIFDGIKPKYMYVGLPDDKPEQSLYYVEKSVLYKKVVNVSENYGQPKKIKEISFKGNVKIGVSPSGRYLYLLDVISHDYELYDCDEWKVLGSGQNIKDIVWGLQADTFAFLKFENNSKRLSVYKVVDKNIKPILENFETLESVKRLFGGGLIGLEFESQNEICFQFIQWNGQQSQGGFLPKPKQIAWDKLSFGCVLVFEDSYAVFSYHPIFKVKCYVKEKIEDAIWWNSTLFLSTSMDIKAVFPLNDKIDQVVLASYDLVRYGCNPEEGGEDTGMDPIPELKPKAPVNLVDVVGNNLITMDCNTELHKIPISHPSLKFRILVVAGCIGRALEWLPFIHEELHDSLADFLCARGYNKEACKIETLSPSKKLTLCIEHGLVDVAFETISQIEQYRYDNLTNRELGYLYIRIGSKAEMLNQKDIAEKSFRRAFDISNLGLNNLVVHYAKYQNSQKLKDLKEERILKNDHSSVAIISFFLFDGNTTRESLKSAKEFSLAALLNSKGEGQQQQQLLSEWENEVAEKYKSITVASFSK
eukprot:gene10372-2901_t